MTYILTFIIVFAGNPEPVNMSVAEFYNESHCNAAAVLIAGDIFETTSATSVTYSCAKDTDAKT